MSFSYGKTLDFCLTKEQCVRAWKGGAKMEIREKEFEEKVARVWVDTAKGFCEYIGFLPPSSPTDRARRLNESVELIVRSIQKMCR